MTAEEEERQEPLDEEWAFDHLAPKQFEALDAKPKKREWEKLWQWEFCRERYRCDEEWRKRIDEIKAKKNAMASKIEMFEGEREAELRLERLLRDPEHWEEIVFPCYLDEWPEHPYLSIPFEKRLGFASIKEGGKNEYPDLELSMWSPGKKTFKVWVDLSWPPSVAKQKFWDWFSYQREYAGGEKIRRTDHGNLNGIKGDLKALGAVRLMNFFSDKNQPWMEAASHADGKDYPLYSQQADYSRSKTTVREMLNTDLF